MTETQVTMRETGQVLATVETVMVQLDTSLTKAVPLTCRDIAAVVEASISWFNMYIYYIINYIITFVHRIQIYTNVPRWWLRDVTFWLYDGLPMVIYFLHDRWLPMLPLQIIVVTSMTSIWIDNGVVTWQNYIGRWQKSPQVLAYWATAASLTLVSRLVKYYLTRWFTFAWKKYTRSIYRLEWP